MNEYCEWLIVSFSQDDIDKAKYIKLEQEFKSICSQLTDTKGIVLLWKDNPTSPMYPKTYYLPPRVVEVSSSIIREYRAERCAPPPKVGLCFYGKRDEFDGLFRS